VILKPRDLLGLPSVLNWILDRAGRNYSTQPEVSWLYGTPPRLILLYYLLEAGRDLDRLGIEELSGWASGGSSMSVTGTIFSDGEHRPIVGVTVDALATVTLSDVPELDGGSVSVPMFTYPASGDLEVYERLFGLPIGSGVHYNDRITYYVNGTTIMALRRASDIFQGDLAHIPTATLVYAVCQSCCWEIYQYAIDMWQAGWYADYDFAEEDPDFAAYAQNPYSRLDDVAVYTPVADGDWTPSGDTWDYPDPPVRKVAHDNIRLVSALGIPIIGACLVAIGRIIKRKER